MDFSAWFEDRYRIKPKGKAEKLEPRFEAIHRLARQANVSWMTVYRALSGKHLQHKTAAALSEATAGAVSREELLLAEPTARKSRAAR
jgi:endo-alpha-1,4-polygalactosaminidase (GH114 family)